MSGPPKNFSEILAEAAEKEVLDSSSADTEAQPDLELGLEEHKIEFQLACLQQEFSELAANHELRLSYTGRIYWMVVAWLVCVVICLAFAGFSAYGFKLSDTVLVAILSTTTVNAIGLFVLVAKWMYPSGGIKNASGSELQAKIAALKPAAKKKKPPKAIG